MYSDISELPNGKLLQIGQDKGVKKQFSILSKMRKQGFQSRKKNKILEGDK